MRAVFLITFLLLFCPVAFAQAAPTPTPTGVEEAYLAKDNGEGKAGDQVTEFSITDVPIFCVVLLESDARAVVKINFVAVSVSGVKPETKVVTASYTTKEGQNRVNFTGRPEGRWTAGKYRVDIFVDGKIVRNLEFQIKGSGSGDNTAAKYLQPRPAPRPKTIKAGSRTKP